MLSVPSTALGMTWGKHEMTRGTSCTLLSCWACRRIKPSPSALHPPLTKWEAFLQRHSELVEESKLFTNFELYDIIILSEFPAVGKFLLTVFTPAVMPHSYKGGGCYEIHSKNSYSDNCIFFSIYYKSKITALVKAAVIS